MGVGKHAGYQGVCEGDLWVDVLFPTAMQAALGCQGMADHPRFIFDMSVSPQPGIWSYEICANREVNASDWEKNS